MTAQELQPILLSSNKIDFSADILDVRDIIARFEELESELNTTFNDKIPSEEDSPEESAVDEELQEYYQLKKVLSELEGNGGDEEWHGSWYPVTLINDDYFEESMDEFVKDCYDIDALKLPSFLTVTIDYDALQMDYTSIDIGDSTYWYR